MIGLVGWSWGSFDGESLTLSWQTLAAMATVSSVVVGIAMAFLKATWGKDLTTATAELSTRLAEAQIKIGDRVRQEVKEAVEPLERRVERLEDRPTPNPFRGPD